MNDYRKLIDAKFVLNEKNYPISTYGLRVLFLELLKNSKYLGLFSVSFLYEITDDECKNSLYNFSEDYTKDQINSFYIPVFIIEANNSALNKTLKKLFF